MFNNHHAHDRGCCGTSGRRYAGDRLRDAGARWVRGRSLLLAVLALALGGQAAAADPVGQLSEFASGPNADSLPAGIAPGADGDLWFADAGTAPVIGRITPSGQITEFSSGLNAGTVPVGIAPGAGGNLWFADRGTTPAIGRITPSGQITEFSSGLNTGSLPGGDRAGGRRQRVVHRPGDDPGDRADHPERSDHRVLHRPERRQLPGSGSRRERTATCGSPTRGRPRRSGGSPRAVRSPSSPAA